METIQVLLEGKLLASGEPRRAPDEKELLRRHLPAFAAACARIIK
jgi:hypothetical protein